MKYRDIILEGMFANPKPKTTDPVLASVLAEARAKPDLKALALDFLKLVKQKVGSKTPQGFGGFEVGWAEQSWSGKVGEIAILYDVPYDIRHMEDDEDQYGPSSKTLEKRAGEYHNMDRIIFQLIHKMNAKNKTIRYGASGGWSGGGVQTTGDPRSSRV